jgi:3-isopropylmalate/(R)-2-methylmalate dehydratase large subunit
MPSTLFDKIWNDHVVKKLDDDIDLIHIDRHLLHEMTSPQAFDDLKKFRRRVKNPELCFAVADHMVSTAPKRENEWVTDAKKLISIMAKNAEEYGIQYFDENHFDQGIVHIFAPELGIVLPGVSVVCGDSHTCTNGALGAIAFGVGTSSVEHILATQTLRMKKPKNVRIVFKGQRKAHVTSKDIALYAIGQAAKNAAVLTGAAIEYAGKPIQEMSMDERFTLCNLSVEFGARLGLIAPDETTIHYVKGKKFAPKGDRWKQAFSHWKNLYTDANAHFDQEIMIDLSRIDCQITWGTHPNEVISIEDCVPNPEMEKTSIQRQETANSISYMGLEPHQKISGIKIDKVFIGSCTNSRLEDLRSAASILRPEHKVAAHVKAMVVPGSQNVKRLAEQEGLHRIFLQAGFEWREPGCSMCIGLNADRLQPGERCVSTSNRNFVGRQGPGGRTHLASPIVAAASAIAGSIINPGKI